jgi:hypothetical protein
MRAWRKREASPIRNNSFQISSISIAVQIFTFKFLFYFLLLFCFLLCVVPLVCVELMLFDGEGRLFTFPPRNLKIKKKVNIDQEKSSITN